MSIAMPAGPQDTQRPSGRRPRGFTRV